MSVSSSLRMSSLPQQTMEEALAECRTAAFQLSTPLSDVFILVKVSSLLALNREIDLIQIEKVLYGCDPSEAFDGYMAYGRDEKHRERLTNIANQYASKLGLSLFSALEGKASFRRLPYASRCHVPGSTEDSSWRREWAREE